MELYSISADNGNSWTTQWLTQEEVAQMKRDYNYIIKAYERSED